MSMIITDDCINCSACAAECPTDAILEPGENIEISGIKFPPISSDHFFIVPEKCNECNGFYELRCVVVCPMDAIDKNY